MQSDVCEVHVGLTHKISGVLCDPKKLFYDISAELCIENNIRRVYNKSSAVAEMGDRGHNRHGPKGGGCYAPFA